MITKNDCLLLLTEMEANNIDVKSYMTKLFASKDLDLDVIKFINDTRRFDISDFYQRIRKSYNDKRSVLYKNIVKEELKEPFENIITLSALLTQILLFSKNIEDKQMFLKHARCHEITIALHNYFKTGDIIPCIKLLQLIKADLKVFESIS